MAAMDELHPQLNVPPILVKDNNYIATKNERSAKAYKKRGFHALKLSVTLGEGQNLFTMGLPGEDATCIGVEKGPDKSAYLTLANSAQAMDGPVDLRIAPIRANLDK